jgi:hypothetical protein
MAENGDLIYHYCSVEAFAGIIGTKTLWLTNVMDTNDRSEFRIVADKCKKAFKNKQGEPDRLIRDIDDMNNWAMPNTYICCFSALGDSLGQWRGYAKQGHGVSIGFTKSALGIPESIPEPSFDCKNLGIMPLEYDDKRQEQLIKDLIDKYPRAYSSDYDGDTYDLCIDAATELCTGIMGLSAVCKHPSFIEEREYRIIYTPVEEKHIPSLRIHNPKAGNLQSSNRIARNKICKHYILPFIPSSITSVTRGSNCDLSRDIILECLVNAQFDPSKIEIKDSTCPYRD